MAWFIRDDHRKGWSFAWIFWERRDGEVNLICAARIRMTKDREHVRAQAIYPKEVRGRWGRPSPDIDDAFRQLGDDLIWQGA